MKSSKLDMYMLCLAFLDISFAFSFCYHLVGDSVYRRWEQVVENALTF